MRNHLLIINMQPMLDFWIKTSICNNRSSQLVNAFLLMLTSVVHSVMPSVIEASMITMVLLKTSENAADFLDRTKVQGILNGTDGFGTSVLVHKSQTKPLLTDHICLSHL